MEEITGYVEHIVWRNADNGYTILDLNVDSQTLTCVGVFPVVSEGESLLLKGQFVDHPNYGHQFKMESYEVVIPEDELSMERYLGSGAIKGIGPKMASRIVAKFGKDTFRIVENEPERLAEIKGISQTKAMEIAAQISETKDVRSAMIFLDKYGFHSAMAMRIYNRFGNEIYNIFKTNPYILADEIDGIGFKRADELATKIGILVDSEFRVKSGIQYVLNQAAGLGHTYLPKDILKQWASELLSVDDDIVSDHIDNLAIDKKVKIIKSADGIQVYLNSFYRLEDGVAAMLLDLDLDFKSNVEEIDDIIAQIEGHEGMVFDELQKRAIKECANRGVFVLTGGPGTGKTTIIKAMIEYFHRKGLEVFLAAPTGRAAKRMSEACGYEAKTIHRLLEVTGISEDSTNPGVSRGMFDRNQDNPLECDAIIIDEMSMVDVFLMNSLLKAIASGTRLILVGDTNQLPSVGPGNVLKDILDSDLFSSVCLEKIFRQGMESHIVINAHKINNGEEVILDNKSDDFFFMRRNDTDSIIADTIGLIQERMPKFVGCKPMDVQVLTPTRMGILGVENLNKILQDKLNPPSDDKPQWSNDERILRLGDKVMQIKNNYQLEWEIIGKYGIPIDKGMGVFNGDVGVITDINDFSKSLTVEYDEGKQVEYPFKSLDELELAYSITVHKSQGSEYPAVIIPLFSGPRMLMNRNIIYTAITRGKKCVIIIGDERIFHEMAANTKVQDRYSGLLDRLKAHIL